jgi:hypothetical protein
MAMQSLAQVRENRPVFPAGRLAFPGITSHPVFKKTWGGVGKFPFSYTNPIIIPDKELI